MANQKYDLIVIGSGPAGEKGAAQAAYFGKRVALIEKQPVLGGAAANTGTIPSKTLRETALYLSGFRHRGLYGIDLSLKKELSVSDLMYRERIVRETERSRIAENLKRHRVDLYIGTASFVDGHTISVRPENAPEVRIEGEVILIATGSYPYRPPQFPFHDPRVYDSDTILTLRSMPRTVLTAGAGVIGSEYACIFSALGIDVTLVDGRPELLPFLDAQVSSCLKSSMEAAGVCTMMPDQVETVAPTPEYVEVQLQSGSRVRVDAILVAAGRNGNTQALGLDKIGVETGKRGHVEVNERYQTSLPHVYAAGDVIGFPALASTSMEQARIAMVHAFDLKYKTDLTHILPLGIYTIPECSAAGETEQSAKEKNIPYVVGKTFYETNARGQIIGEQGAFLKLIFQREDLKVIGVHVIGEQATDLVHVGLTAMLMGAGADVFINTCYNFPTLGEMYKYATYDALGKKAQSA
ncbi:MAG: Si-specific NAD(P)(+) transhydrogenase [Acidobacteriota bacterium]